VRERRNQPGLGWLSHIAISRRADLDIIVINRPEMAPLGAGEQATIPIAAAIGNAIFDARARACARCRSPKRALAALQKT
jgi:CO/xanthine dehydrogenase Mo-binding subunit